MIRKTFLYFVNNPLCHTWSKVWLVSMKAAEQYLFLSRFLFIVLTVLCTCSILPCWLRTLNWWLTINFRFSITDFRCTRSNFLDTYDNIGSKLISLLDYFTLLNISFIALRRLWDNSWSTLPVIKSISGAFFGLISFGLKLYVWILLQ